MVNSLRYKIILQQFKNKIYSYSYCILRNKMDAEDVTQEVLIILWKNLDNINFNAAKTWLMKTTYNKCIDFIRKRNLIFSREKDLNEEDAEMIHDPHSAMQPELIFEKKQVHNIIHNAIGNLPENQKHALILYEIQGLKYKEISKIMDIPINTIKVYILRARRNLLKEFKREELLNV